MPSVKEKDGNVLITVAGRRGPTHRSMSLEDAEEFREDLEQAIEEARRQSD